CAKHEYGNGFDYW
nr:immunoglobulin heavy chain junction region [Macaca mulatta]MOV39893.1 immunoglobulin heavy chain junction region [Macaca mulatta]